MFEYGISPKWLELLKEIAPRTVRVGIFRDPTSTAQIGLLGGIQAAAPTFAVELRLIDVRDTGEIERSVAALARFPHAGLIVHTNPSSRRHYHAGLPLSPTCRLFGPCSRYSRWLGVLRSGSRGPISARRRLR